MVASLENGKAGTGEEPVNGAATSVSTETPEPAAAEAAPSVPAAEETEVVAVDAAAGERPTLLVEQTVGKESDGDLNLELRLSAPSTLPVVLIVTA